MARNDEQIALTATLVALVHRKVDDPGPTDDRVQMGDQEFLDAAHRLIGDLGGDDLWVFAYGSLIWRPDFDFVEQRVCQVYGWHRSFSLHIERWRGSLEQPGLMLGLERGGSCRGVAFRIKPDDLLSQVVRVLRREASNVGDFHSMRWVTADTGQGRIRALTFWAGSLPKYSVNLSLHEQAYRLARAVGHLGSGAEYLHNLVVHLNEHGIHDRQMWLLQQLVAEEIRQAHGPQPPSERICMPAE